MLPHFRTPSIWPRLSVLLRMVLRTARFSSMEEASRFQATLKATSLAPLSLTTFAQVSPTTTRKSLDQSCRSSVSTQFKKQLTSPMPTNGAMAQLSLRAMATLLVNSRPRSRLARLVSTCPSPFPSQCSHSLVTKLACGASLTSTARALFNSILNGRRSLLVGRRSLPRPSVFRRTSQP